MACRDVYAAQFGDLRKNISDAEWEAVERQFNGIDEILSENGDDAATIIGQIGNPADMGSMARRVETIVDQMFRDELRDHARKSYKTILSETKQIALRAEAEKRITNMKGWHKLKVPMQRLNALTDLLVDKSGLGGATLERTIQGLKNDVISRGVIQPLEKLMGKAYDAPLKDAQFSRDVLNEYFNIHKGKGKTAQSPKAREYAQILYDARNNQRIAMNMAGGERSIRKNTPSVHLDWAKIKEKKDDFVRVLADAMDAETHGDAAKRVELATKIYDHLDQHNGTFHPDQIGDLAPLQNVADKERYGSLDPILDIKDGDAWVNLNDLFGNVRNPLHGMMSDLRRNSVRHAAMKLFGADPFDHKFTTIGKDGKETTMTKRGDFGRLLDWAATSEDGSRHGKHAAEVEAWFNRLVDTGPEEIRYAKTIKTMKFARNIQVWGKMGSAVLAALTDPITMVLHLYRFENVPLYRILGSIPAALSSKARQRAEYLFSAGEGASNYLFNRTGGGVNENGSTFSSASIADWTIKIEGLSFFDGATRAIIVRTLDRQFGNLINSGATWEQLGKSHPSLQAMMTRHRFDADSWKAIAKKAHVDEDGHFDLFKIPDEGPSGRITNHERLTGLYIDIGKGAQISPDAYDRHMLRIFGEPGSLRGEVGMMITQFQGMAFASYRKLAKRLVKDTELSLAQKIQTGAALLGLNIFASMMVVQARQVLAGKQPYKPESWDLLKASLMYQPIGLPVDIFMKAVGNNALKAIGSQQGFTGASDAFEVLGPAISSFIQIANSGAQMGIHAAMGDETKARKDAWRTANQLLRTVPGNNLWFTTFLFQHYVADQFHEWLDPDGYKKSEARKEKDISDRLDLQTFGPATSNSNFLVNPATYR